MKKKEILGFVVFFLCVFIVLIIGKSFSIINTGLSLNGQCLVGPINELFLDLNLFFFQLGSYLILGILPFGFGFVLFFAVNKLFFKNYFFKKPSKSLRSKDISIYGKIFMILFIPAPLIFYDLLFC